VGGTEFEMTLERADVRDAWIEMMRKLENLEVHHRRPKYLTKEELWSILEGLLEVASAESE